MGCPADLQIPFIHSFGNTRSHPIDCWSGRSLRPLDLSPQPHLLLSQLLPPPHPLSAGFSLFCLSQPASCGLCFRDPTLSTAKVCRPPVPFPREFSLSVPQRVSERPPFTREVGNMPNHPVYSSQRQGPGTSASCLGFSTCTFPSAHSSPVSALHRADLIGREDWKTISCTIMLMKCDVLSDQKVSLC